MLDNKKHIDLENLSVFKEEMDASIDEKVSTKQDTLVSGTNIKTINGDSILGSGDLSLSVDHMTEILWADLKALRDNSELTPGMYYRITDYECTTTQANTSSAGHVFDIIVLATANNQLSERCWADHHNGDTYFKNSNLNAWQVWYSLDNNKNHYKWADEINGKGVIYRLIDEFDNDICYDFKNILYSSAYTFHGKDGIDSSLSGLVESKYCHHNTIMPCCADKNFEGRSYPLILNEIKFRNQYGNGEWSNNFFDACCYSCTLGGNSSHNKFKAGCYNMNLNNGTSANSFGYRCHDISFNYTCANNIFGDECSNIVFNESCNQNTFGIYCHNIYLGMYCSNNIFGASCSYIRTGLPDTTLERYMWYNIFDNNCKYIQLRATQTGSNYLQNVHIHSGVNGTSNEYVDLVIDRNLSYTTDIYAQGSTEIIVGGNN